MYERIPNELKQLNHWVCWKRVKDPKHPEKPKKVPINARTGMEAKSDDPSTWCDFSTAAASAVEFAGIGFMFSGSGYFGVDIDGIADEIFSFTSGEYSDDNIVAEFTSALGSYTEFSQSGAGIHIICRGKLPGEGCRHENVEMYDSGRYFAMTGDIIGNFSQIADGEKSIKPLYEKYIGAYRNTSSVKPAPQHEKNRPRMSRNEDELLHIAMNSRQGLAFSELYAGHWEGKYSSQSEADMALCSMLAFWCGKDTAMMDKLFRRSGLMREKWDRKQSGSTYGALTLQKAAATCDKVFSPKTDDDYRIEIVADGEATDDNGKIKTYSFDDMGNAQRMLDLFGQKILYNYNEKKWLIYDGIRWRTDGTGFIRTLADRSIARMSVEAAYYESQGEDMAKAFQKHLKSCRSNKSKNAMLSELEHHVPVTPNDLDRNKALLNTADCVIDLRTLETQPHDAELLITKHTPIKYKPDAECPLWEKFLYEIFGGDEELVGYIQRAVGYSLTGSTSEQCAFFLYGSGSNGKSTFLDIVREICGDYATNIQPETIMVRPNGGTASSDVARLKGARFVTSVEPNEGMRINEGLLKQLTGDDIVTARKLYSEEFEFRPEFKLWMATNHKPIIRGTDTGIWRRVRMIPFTVHIPPDKVDRNLKDKLLGELEGIFAWAVKGVKLYNEQGLRMPAAVAAAVEEYRAEMDVISSFVSSCCIVEAGRQVKANDLYRVYSEWCSRNNEYCMSSTKFGTEIAKRYQKMHIRSGWIYCNICLNQEYAPYQMSIGKEA